MQRQNKEVLGNTSIQPVKSGSHKGAVENGFRFGRVTTLIANWGYSSPSLRGKWLPIRKGYDGGYSSPNLQHNFVENGFRFGRVTTLEILLDEVDNFRGKWLPIRKGYDFPPFFTLKFQKMWKMASDSEGLRQMIIIRIF